MGFDISKDNPQDDAERGSWFADFVHPKGDDVSELAFHMRGANSRTARKSLSRITERWQRKRRLTLEEQLEMDCEWLAALTIDWRGLEDGDEPFPCTAENAKALYLKYDWLRVPLFEFVKDSGNF